MLPYRGELSPVLVGGGRIERSKGKSMHLLAGGCAVSGFSDIFTCLPPPIWRVAPAQRSRATQPPTRTQSYFPTVTALQRLRLPPWPAPQLARHLTMQASQQPRPRDAPLLQPPPATTPTMLKAQQWPWRHRYPPAPPAPRRTGRWTATLPP